MKKLVDIIIPAYNAHNTLEKLLASLVAQVNIDEAVITIVNDASSEDYKQIIEKFNNMLDISIINLEENVGPGTARQIGIDSTNCEYIMFVDADDMLYTPIALKALLNAITSNNFDVAFGEMLQINLSTGESKIISANQWTWVLGVIYKRAMLKRYDIRFNNSSRGEDVGFNKQVRLYTPFDKIAYVNSPVYLWTDQNKKNRINQDSYIMFESKVGFAENTIYAFDRFKREDSYLDDTSLMLEKLASLTSMYFQLQDIAWHNPDKTDEFIALIQIFYNNHIAEMIKNVPSETLWEVYDLNLKKMYRDIKAVPVGATYFGFLDMLEKGYVASQQ